MFFISQYSFFNVLRCNKKYIYLPTPNSMSKSWNTECMLQKYSKSENSSICLESSSNVRLMELTCQSDHEDNWSEQPGIEGLGALFKWCQVSLAKEKVQITQSKHRNHAQWHLCLHFLILGFSPDGLCHGLLWRPHEKMGQRLKNWSLSCLHLVAATLVRVYGFQNLFSSSLKDDLCLFLYVCPISVHVCLSLLLSLHCWITSI